MITVLPDPQGRAGTAQLRVTGAAGSVSAPGLRVRREGWDADVLGPNGWQGEDAMLQPNEAAVDGPDLLLTLGWAACQHMEAGTYLIAVPRAGLEEAASWPDIRPVRAASRSRPVRPVALPPGPPPSLPPSPAPTLLAPPPSAALGTLVESPLPVIEPRLPAASPVHKAGNGLVIGIIAGMVALLLLSGGGYYYWRTRQAAAATAAVDPAHQPPPTAPVPNSSPSHPPAQLADMSVPDVLSHAPNPAAIAAEGRRRMAAQQHDDGMLLLEEAADQGDGSAMAALGALYDPVGFQPSPVIARPDPRQAARYYRVAARAGVSNIRAKRNALQAWLRSRASGGDLQSDLILRDFWQ